MSDATPAPAERAGLPEAGRGRGWTAGRGCRPGWSCVHPGEWAGVGARCGRARRPRILCGPLRAAGGAGPSASSPGAHLHGRRPGDSRVCRPRRPDGSSGERGGPSGQLHSRPFPTRGAANLSQRGHSPHGGPRGAAPARPSGARPGAVRAGGGADPRRASVLRIVSPRINKGPGTVQCSRRAAPGPEGLPLSRPHTGKMVLDGSAAGPRMRTRCKESRCSRARERSLWVASRPRGAADATRHLRPRRGKQGTFGLVLCFRQDHSKGGTSPRVGGEGGFGGPGLSRPLSPPLVPQRTEEQTQAAWRESENEVRRVSPPSARPLKITFRERW